MRSEYMERKIQELIANEEKIKQSYTIQNPTIQMKDAAKKTYNYTKGEHTIEILKTEQPVNIYVSGSATVIINTNEVNVKRMNVKTMNNERGATINNN